MRLLLGIAEAGFFPGIIFYLTCWFPSQHRARIIALFMIALPLSSVIGAPISTALLDISAAGLALEQEKWGGALYFAERALEIPARSRSYLNEPESWGARPYDLAALAAYYMGLYETALSYGREALAQEPENGRLRKNLEFYEAAAAKM